MSRPCTVPIDFPCLHHLLQFYLIILLPPSVHVIFSGCWENQYHGAPGKIELYVPFSTLIISLQRRCYRRKVSEKVAFDHVAISDFSVLVLRVISNNTVSVCLALPQYQRWEGHGNLLNCAIVMTAISDTSYKSMSHRDFLFPLIYSTQFRVFFKVCC